MFGALEHTYLGTGDYVVRYRLCYLCHFHRLSLSSGKWVRDESSPNSLHQYIVWVWVHSLTGQVVSFFSQEKGSRYCYQLVFGMGDIT